MSPSLFDCSRSTDRSVSVALGYVLVLGISTILISGLLIAGGSFVEDNRERVIDSEMKVIGNHIAGNMEQVDRMVMASEDNVGEGPDRAHINQSFQRLVTGSAYNVQVVDDGNPQVVLTSSDPEVTVHVNMTVQTDVEEKTVSGGKISVYYDTDQETLVITSA